MQFWQKPNQGHCLLSIAMETTQSRQTGTCKTRWMGDYFMTCSPLTLQTPVTIQTARPPISTGNIGKWLSEIIFGWKNYTKCCRNISILTIITFSFELSSRICHYSPVHHMIIVQEHRHPLRVAKIYSFPSLSFPKPALFHCITLYSAERKHLFIFKIMMCPKRCNYKGTTPRLIASSASIDPFDILIWTA